MASDGGEKTFLLDLKGSGAARLRSVVQQRLSEFSESFTDEVLAVGPSSMNPSRCRGPGIHSAASRDKQEEPAIFPSSLSPLVDEVLAIWPRQAHTVHTT